MTLNYELKNPYGVADLKDYDALINDDSYFPFDKNGSIDDDKVVSFFLKIGYVYHYETEKWYQLNFDGLFYPVPNYEIEQMVMVFLDFHARRSGLNISTKYPDAIIRRLKATSYRRQCLEKMDDFIINHPEYEISNIDEKWRIMERSFIPVKNGVINPETMELLPHCAYFLHPYVYNFNYKKLSENEILFGPQMAIYEQIIPNPATLRHFLWWVGSVIFSPDVPRMILFLYGLGGTGKTTLSLGLSRILTPDLTVETNRNALKSVFASSAFVGKKLIVFDEMSSNGEFLPDDFFKKLTGGNPVQTIERKYKDPENFLLRAKIMMMGNTHPQFAQKDDALLDRLHIIRCKQKQDKSIRDLVVADDVLNWLFNAGYYFFVEKHPQTEVKSYSDLRTPEMIEELEFYKETDGFVFWLKDYCNTDFLNVDIVHQNILKKPTIEVYRDYAEFTLSGGGKPLSNRSFNARLRLEFDLISSTIRNEYGVYRGFILSRGGVNE